MAVSKRLTTTLRWARRIAIGFLALAAAVALIVIATPQGRVAWRTALFIPQVTPSIPIEPQAWFTRDPTREEVFFAAGNGLASADMYAPAGDGKHSAALLFLGVNPAGRDDPRVVNLANALARSGAVVMIPWSEGMTSKRVSVEDVDMLVRAFQYMTAHERVDAERAGVAGFCVGASLVAVAASDARISDDVRFVNFFGGYFDARDLVAAVASRSRYYAGVTEAWSPDKLSVEVATTHLIDSVADATEAAQLRRAFVEGGEPLSEAELAALSEEGRIARELLSEPDAQTARALVERLSPESLATLDAISPAASIDGLKARTLIMHDVEDRLVPAAESRRLAEALADRGDVHHTEFSLFQHVTPTRPLSAGAYVREIAKMFAHMYRVLNELR